MGNIFKANYNKYIASLVAQRVRHLPAMWETQVQSLGREDPLEKDPRPGPLFEGNPVGEGTTRRGRSAVAGLGAEPSDTHVKAPLSPRLSGGRIPLR